MSLSRPKKAPAKKAGAVAASTVSRSAVSAGDERVEIHDKHTTWNEFWVKAGGEPRKLGPRRVSLPLFPELV